VKAGILAAATYPHDVIRNAQTGAEKPDPRGGMHVATIAAALEYGNGQNHPRPFMQSTVAQQRDAWTDGIVRLARSGMPFAEALATIGQVMAEDIQTTIADWPADNSEEWAAFKGFSHGLIFTNHLLKSVSFEVDTEA
jgi:hypothetical protein